MTIARNVRTDPRRQAAQAALEASDWPRAAELLRDSLAGREDPEARLSLATALWCDYAVDDALQQLQLAYRGFLRVGLPGRAAWVACWIAWEEAAIHGKPSVAQGWFGRAARLQDGLAPGPEPGWLRVWRAAFDGDPLALAEASRDGIDIARRYGDTDLEMLSLAEQGVALVALGQARDGMASLDQAMAGVLAGEVRSPVVISDCFCAMLGACEHIGDYGRAEEWCEAARRTADARSIRFLSASCHVTYGSLLATTGRYRDAEREIGAALRMFETGHRHLRLDALARLADLRRRQGRIVEARELLVDAHGLGPALRVRTELDLQEGRPDRALQSARRLGERAVGAGGRAVSLALIVRASAAAGDAPGAVAALAEFEPLAGTIATPSVLASLWLARGAVARMQRRLPDAITAYAEAADLYAGTGMPVEATQARRELATTLREAGHAVDADEHDRETQAALGRIGRTESAPLTARELEVLQLLAAGHGNRRIAQILGISPHTIHRHVANLLRKLDAPTRAAAVAGATRLGLI